MQRRSPRPSPVIPDCPLPVLPGLEFAPAGRSTSRFRTPSNTGVRLHYHSFCNATAETGVGGLADRRHNLRSGSRTPATRSFTQLPSLDVPVGCKHTFLSDSQCNLRYRHLPYALHRPAGTVPAGEMTPADNGPRSRRRCLQIHANCKWQDMRKTASLRALIALSAAETLSSLLPKTRKPAASLLRERLEMC